MDRKKKNLVIFDDCITERDQTIQKAFFTKGRHNSCSCIYLTQRFFGLDEYIKLNSNVFILFHLNKRNLSNIIQSVDVGDENNFKQLCRTQFTNPRNHNYILINIEAPLNQRLITNVFH